MSESKHMILVIALVVCVIGACATGVVLAIQDANKPGNDKVCLNFDNLPVYMIVRSGNTTVIRAGSGWNEAVLYYQMSLEDHAKLVEQFEAWKESKRKSIAKE